MLAIFKKSNPNPNYPWVFLTRTYSTGSYPRHNLYSRISPLGNPNFSMVPVLDQWVHEGEKVRESNLRSIIRDLRGRKRYSHALEISEWMSSKGLCPFSPGDRAVQLDLIGRVRGSNAAESYFDMLNEHEKIGNMYGALLNCYVREGLVDKSTSHMQKMKEMGFGSALNYNDIMCLFTHTGQLEKIPDVLSDMKNDGVSPDIFSYRICINSYGARSDLKNMEKLLKEMENQPHISIDWITYSTVANIYIKAGSKEKALIYLKKLEAQLQKDPRGYNHLISFYASLGNKGEVRRLWGLQKGACKKQINRDYVTMLGSLVKLGELEEARVLLQEWESSCQFYDFRVPNVLLIGYCQKGLIEKAEGLLQEIMERGKTPIPNSWAIIAAAYSDKGNMEKTFECMKNALEVKEENPGWRPKPLLISSILSWLNDRGEVEEAEAFVGSLKTVAGIDTNMLGLE
ncbi:pentatricopeptide repeat-containing protein At4g21705, mitochondrial-like isoform X1 [Rhododendron vialii]|uniref:pentatricopeptide repeat-containing protein At4g21705, mitochondrial-like isoform X1 n=2 Tax=Rhododendron vialii TaxID=182163 RepID=UPI00265ED398|nr:pentatricopeptide repeat-containing protein At4g21705, mitochondrial-like isoform X1 [Rhododendron vialii]